MYVDVQMGVQSLQHQQRLDVYVCSIARVPSCGTSVVWHAVHGTCVNMHAISVAYMHECVWIQ